MGGIELIRVIRICLIIGLVSLIVGCSSEEGKSDNISKENVIKREELADIFLNGDFERIYSQMDKDFQQQVSLKQLQDIGEEFNDGVNTYDLQSELPLNDKLTQFIWIDDKNSKGMLATFDKDHTIVGLQVIHINSHPETDNVFTETEFQLPFEGEWFVFWGGANVLVNYHYEHENQRYAFDFLMMKNNSTYDGDPIKNESYYAFGENYLAPADGTVIEVVNDIRDNEPVGEMNREQPYGNYVIIDHGNSEYSHLAHFKYGSIKVNEGDDVKQGDILGLVGNSGNSSEPHIHFHVADSPDLEDSKSIRINLVGHEDLIRGDFVKP